VISLFSNSPKKDVSSQLEDQAVRARIEETINWAIEVPEVTIPDEMQEFFARDEASETAKPEAAAADPWDVVKEFMREEVTENAA